MLKVSTLRKNFLTPGLFPWAYFDFCFRTFQSNFSPMAMTFSNSATVRLECHGLFDHLFTPANFGNNAEQATFRLF